MVGARAPGMEQISRLASYSDQHCGVGGVQGLGGGVQGLRFRGGRW